MALELTVLGCNAAMPAHGRITSAQVLKSNNHLYLIDCGEGTQIRFNEYKIKRNKIQVICISHLHGDHIYGLPGVLSSYFYFSRATKLCIIGPKGIKQFVEAFMDTSNLQLGFEIEFVEHTASILSKVFENTDLDIYAFPLKHRIPTNGYLFKEKTPNKNIDKTKIQKYNLTVEEILQFKSGADVIRENGQLIREADVMIQKTKAKSYAYCSDTIYDPDVIPFVKDVDLLYHESTYLHELAEKAKERMHSTSLEAAEIARAAKVKKLLLGHFSGVYRKPQALGDEAKTVFENTVTAYDGIMLEI